MGMAPLATAGIGMGVGLIGSYLKTQADQQQLQARANANKENEELAFGQAADALQRGQWQAGQIRQRTSQMIGQQRADYASSGVDENSGTPLNVQAATQGMSELDVATTMNNARRQAWGYQVTATQYGQQAVLDENGVNEVGLGNYLGATGQVLGGIGRFANADKPDFAGSY